MLLLNTLYMQKYVRSTKGPGVRGNNHTTTMWAHRGSKAQYYTPSKPVVSPRLLCGVTTHIMLEVYPAEIEHNR